MKEVVAIIRRHNLPETKAGLLGTMASIKLLSINKNKFI